MTWDFCGTTSAYRAQLRERIARAQTLRMRVVNMGRPDERTALLARLDGRIATLFDQLRATKGRR